MIETAEIAKHISDSLAPLFKEARETGKWFWCPYQNLWFSPDQLEAAQSDGRFRWGAINWKLRDPRERIAEAMDRSTKARDEALRIANEVARG
jgi:hypothetical protein